MNRQLLTVALSVLLLISLGSVATADIMVDFEPNPADIIAGDNFSIALLASIPDATPVTSWGFGLDITNPEYLSLQSIAIGDSWSPSPSNTADRFGGFAFPEPVFGDVLLASLTFECLGVGTSYLGLVDDGSPQFGFVGEGQTIGEISLPGDPIDYSASQGTINQVPEPSTLILLGTGCVVGVAAIRRKRRASSS